jgi:hypothetical protein
MSPFPSKHTQQNVTWNRSTLLSITVYFTQHCTTKRTCSQSTRTWIPFCQRPLHLKLSLITNTIKYLVYSPSLWQPNAVFLGTAITNTWSVTVDSINYQFSLKKKHYTTYMRFDMPVVLSIDCNLLGYDTINFGRWITMFWRSCSLHHQHKRAAFGGEITVEIQGWILNAAHK